MTGELQLGRLDVEMREDWRLETGDSEEFVDHWIISSRHSGSVNQESACWTEPLSCPRVKGHISVRETLFHRGLFGTVLTGALIGVRHSILGRQREAGCLVRHSYQDRVKHPFFGTEVFVAPVLCQSPRRISTECLA